MKIGLVRKGYSASGGAERYLKRFAAAMVDAGHKSVLFCSPDWPDADWTHGERVVVPGDSPKGFADALSALKPKERCDFLFSLERVWECDCYRAGDGVHRFWLDQRNRYESFLKSRLRSLTGKHRELLSLEEAAFKDRKAQCVIANSRMVRQDITRIYGYPDHRIYVVYNGVPGRSFERHPAVRKRVREELGIYDTELLVLFVGSGWERKGLRYAIDAVARLPESAHARLVVVGKGNRLAYRSSGVVFVGEVSDTLPYLQAADLFLLPTLYDPFSNACLEAMACGLPVITTTMNGFSEVVESGLDSEILASPEDVAGISNAILAWTDPVRRHSARSHLQEKAQRYSVEANFDTTMTVIERQMTAFR